MYLVIVLKFKINAMNIEWWKYIKGYEGLYMVSTKGRVKSVERCIVYKDGRKKVIKEKILKLMLCNNGYYKVGLSKNGIVKEYSVHRLVAEAFKPNPDNLPTVDHINRIRTDNRLENLRWAPYELQQKNRNEIIRINRKDLSKSVLQYTLDMVFVKEYPSVMEAERQTGIRHISECCRGERRTAGGYIWKYK